MLTVPTSALKFAKAAHRPPSHSSRRASVAAANQKKAAPTHVHWKPVFHLAGPIAEITRPRRSATCRKIVISSSRPSTTAMIQPGSGVVPNEDQKGKKRVVSGVRPLPALKNVASHSQRGDWSKYIGS